MAKFDPQGVDRTSGQTTTGRRSDVVAGRAWVEVGPPTTIYYIMS